MIEIKTDFQLLLEINRIIVNQISDAVIIQLKGLAGEHLLNSVDDSGLINVWEEICVQVQGENSDSWDADNSVIENLIKDELRKQPDGFKILISYVGGIGESVDSENDEDEYSYYEENAIIEIMDAVISKAGAYQNENITRFLEQDFDDDSDVKEKD